MRPPTLYDTELAGRLAGFDRVNLAAMVAATARPAVCQGSRRRRLVQAPAARGLAELRRTGRRGAAGTARRGRGGTRRAGQVRLGGTGIRTPAHLRGARRPDATVGGARRASTRSATAARWPRCANCGPPATTSPGAATSPRAGSCPTAAIINAATADPNTVEKLLALPVFGGSRQRRSAQVWLDALAPRPRPPRPADSSEPPTGRRPRCGGAAASPRPPHDWRPPRGPRRTVATGFGARPRTWSPRNWCAGCAGTGSRCRPPPRRSTRS